MTLSATHVAAIEKALGYGFSDIAIARKLGLPTSHPVYAYRTKIGFSQDQVVASRIRAWAGLVSGGEPLEKIAKTYGLKNPRTIKVQLWKAGFSWKTLSFAKLTPVQEGQIKSLVAEGKSDDEIGKAIGAGPFQISLYRVDHGIRNERSRVR